MANDLYFFGELQYSDRLKVPTCKTIEITLGQIIILTRKLPVILCSKIKIQ